MGFALVRNKHGGGNKAAYPAAAATVGNEHVVETESSQAGDIGGMAMRPVTDQFVRVVIVGWRYRDGGKPGRLKMVFQMDSDVG